MLNLVSADPGFINVTTMQDYSATNGQPALTIQLNPGYEISTINFRVVELENKVNKLMSDQENTMRLIKSNVALNDLYEKYMVMLALVKENDPK